MKKICLVIITVCLLSCTKAPLSREKDASNYDELPIYSGLFEGYIYFANYRNSLYLVQEMYFDNLQPYIVNETEFCSLLEKETNYESKQSSLPDVELDSYISDFSRLEGKNKYRIVYSICAHSDDDLKKTKTLVSEFKFKIAFSDNTVATEKNEYIQKLNEPVQFLLLNDGKEIEIN